MPELQVLNGSLQWRTIPVSGERFLIGRKDTCHLALKDGWVSREHTLIISPKAGEYRVQDLDSENGTFLNGEKIRDSVVKHGDLLRVGRTEMRFVLHEGATAALEIPPAEFEGESAEAGLRTHAEQGGAEPALQTLSVRPPAAGGPEETQKAEAPRIDLRERVRLLEERLLEGEQANAALAAENAVLKKALARLGVIDRKTGAIDDGKLASSSRKTSVPGPMLPFVTNPVARIAFPGLEPSGGPAARGSNPALFELGLLGLDALGIRFAECVSRLGYRSAAAITAERDAMRGGVIDPDWRIYVDRPRTGRPGAIRAQDHALTPAMPRIEEVCAEAFGGCHRVLLCAAASSPLAAEALSILAEVVARAGSAPGLVIFFDPRDNLVAARERATRALAAARSLAESGRCAPLLVVDLDQAGRLTGGTGSEPSLSTLDTIAGALDALLRLPMVPSIDADVDPAAVAKALLAKGWSTLGLGATRDPGKKAVKDAFAGAISGGLLTRTMPASRARSAIMLAVVGRGDARDSDIEAGRASVAKLLPQARRIEATYQDAGDAVRVVAWIGGLPYPETFFDEKEPGP